LQTEAWAGHAAGTEEAIRVFGADCSYPLQLLSEVSSVLLLVDSLFELIIKPCENPHISAHLHSAREYRS